jgi:hypothetical protein
MYDATTYQVARQWEGDLSWKQNACLMDAILISGRIVDLGGVSVLPLVVQGIKIYFTLF